MIDVTAPPFSIAPPASPDPDNPDFSFETTDWLEPPVLSEVINDPTSSSVSRSSLLNQYRALVNPTKWHRYLSLGFYLFPDGREFETIWNTQPVDWLQRHQIIWYSYQHHVVHQLDIPPKLFAWATQISQAFLIAHAPAFIDIDPTDPIILQQLLGPQQPPWQTVGPKQSKKKVTYNLEHSPPDSPSRIKPPVPTGGSSLAQAANPVPASASVLTPLNLPASKKKHNGSILGRMSTKSGDSIRAAWKPADKPASVAQPSIATDPPIIEVPPTKNSPTDTIVDDDMSDGKQSAFQPLLNVPTNDGTQRITIRWTPTKQGLSPDKNPGEWTQAALLMLQDLFRDEHGFMYRWESTDLSKWIQLSKLTAADLRDFISPSITYVHARKMFTFGLRFGFSSKNPIAWQSQPSTKTAMREHKIWATVSNSSCLSGTLVNAGYILMKAPNTTHRIRYLQSLRNRLPDNTPFFDIQLIRKTPLDQPIHHLVVQCGEYHVAPLTKALSTILTGSNGAVFLPRIVLGNLSTDQLTKYFTTHSDYVKSLRPISLAPFVTNLDTIREEFFPNGEVLKRTTRDWATSITLANTGVSARCDIVNGGNTQTATLLVPRHVFSEVQAEVSRYKLRINPLARREARFLDNIPGLPEVIHIDLSIQQSLDCLEMMSSEDIWKPTSSSAQNPTPAEASRNRPKDTQNPARHHRSANSEASQLSGPTDTSDISFQDTAPSSKSSRKKKGTIQSANNAWGLASTASTQSAMTPSIATTQNQEYMDLEKLLDLQQVQIENVQVESATKWNELTQQVQANQESQNGRFDDLERKVTKSMKSLTTNNASLASLQQQFALMMDMLKDLTKKESRKRTKTRHLQMRLAEVDEDESQDAIMYPITELAPPPTAAHAPTESSTTTSSDTEDIYSAPADVPPPLETNTPTGPRNKKRTANDLDQQDDMSEDESSDGNSTHSYISGVSQINEADASDDMLSDTESLSSEDQRLLALADIQADASTMELPLSLTSPPLNAQYTKPRDSAGGEAG